MVSNIQSEILKYCETHDVGVLYNEILGENKLSVTLNKGKLLASIEIVFGIESVTGFSYDFFILSTKTEKISEMRTSFYIHMDDVIKCVIRDIGLLIKMSESP
jgi:hypothetical protein